MKWPDTQNFLHTSHFPRPLQGLSVPPEHSVNKFIQKIERNRCLYRYDDQHLTSDKKREINCAIFIVRVIREQSK